MKSFLRSFIYSIFYIFLFCIVLIVAIPKDKLYYTLASELSKQDIKIVTLDENFGTLDIKLNGVEIYISDSKIAHIDSFILSPWKIEASMILFHSNLKGIIPNIKRIEILPRIDNFILAVGSFGKLDSSIDIKNKKIIVTADISNKIASQYNNIFSHFKKTSKGYIYEYIF